MPNSNCCDQVLKDGGFVDSFQVSWGSLQINPNLRVLDEDSGSATDSSADANVFQVIDS